MKRFIRRPSPAMVVACVALFASLTGVSYGVATGFINSREIKNNTIRGKDVRTATLTGSDIKESRLGVVPQAEAVSHTAVVGGGGRLVRGRGVSSAARTGTGRYQVIFNRDVRACVYVATVGDTSAVGPPSGTVSVRSLPTIVNGVDVRTVDYNTNGDVLANKPFHLMVSC